MTKLLEEAITRLSLARALVGEIDDGKPVTQLRNFLIEPRVGRVSAA